MNLFQFFRPDLFPVNDEQNSFNLTDKRQIGFLMIDYLFHTLILKKYIHILNYQLNCRPYCPNSSGRQNNFVHVYNHFYEMALLFCYG